MDNQVGQATRSLCPITCGCDRPDSKLIMSGPQGGCPPTCSNSAKFIEVLTNRSCNDMTGSQLNATPAWNYFVAQMVEISNTAPYPANWQVYLGALSAEMTLRGCEAVQTVRMLQADLCDESPDKGMPFKSVRFYCPVSCQCQSSMLNCPKTCPSVTTASNVTGIANVTTTITTTTATTSLSSGFRRHFHAGDFEDGASLEYLKKQ